MQPMTTSLTQLLNVKSPIIVAPMFTASTPELVTAVTGAGAFGLVAAGLHPSEKIKAELQYIRKTLEIPAGVPLPTGVGLIGWILDRTEVSDDPRIPMVLDEMPVVIWLAFGDNLGQYVSQVRTYDEKRAHKTLVFVIVNSVAEAKRAAIDWKVDAIVVQGMEAGGHGSSASPPLFTFIQAVLMALPNGPPILAAGGVSTGAQIASLLTLGAAGVVLGTRFLFTRECMYSDEMKAILVDAGLYSTARNSVFDEVNGTPPRTTWPEGIDGRAVANKIITDYESGLSMEERLVKFQSGQKDGDKERLLIWAGIGSGLVNEIKGASEIVRELHDETISALKYASSLIM